MWFSWSEYSTTRKSSRQPAAMAARTRAFTSLARSVRSPSHTFIVTSTGRYPASLARFASETPACSPVGLRRAPRRLPVEEPKLSLAELPLHVEQVSDLAEFVR